MIFQIVRPVKRFGARPRLTATPGAISLRQADDAGGCVMRAKLNLTVEKAVADEARALGVNMSRVAEDAIAAANKIERNRRWVEENRDALDAYAARIEAEGPALARWRLF
jgi:antitoxin CcdA